jgi:hypothetical protein
VRAAIEGAQPHLLGTWHLGQAVNNPGLWLCATTLAVHRMPFILIGPVPLAWLWRREAPLTHRDLALLATLMIMLALALTMVPKRFNCYLIPVFPANDVLAAGGILLAVR